MWFAVATGGPLGAIAVRIGNSLPALLFGLHGGIAADRWDRRRTMIACDVLRFAVLVPVAVAAVAGVAAAASVSASTRRALAARPAC
jgi:Transmembrane secretion effector